MTDAEKYRQSLNQAKQDAEAVSLNNSYPSEVRSEAQGHLNNIQALLNESADWDEP